MTLRSSTVTLTLAVALATTAVACGLAPQPSQTLADRMATNGGGYVFRPLDPGALPKGALNADDALRKVADYGPRFVVQRMQFGEVRPNVAGPSMLAYVVEVIDPDRRERGPQLIMLNADNGEIFGGPGTS